MQVTVEEISPVEKKVAVQIEWPLVAARLDEAYRELGRGVTLKGFRKGKVPRNILERMYARQVESEVKQRLVQESFLKAVEEHELAPVVEPVVDDMKLEKGQGFAYSARVEVRAPFEPHDYFGVELVREQPSVNDDEVEEALRARQRDLTQFRKIEGRDALRRGDVAVVDVEGEAGGKPIKRVGVMVDVGADAEGPGSIRPAEGLPGLGQALVGLPLGAKDHELTFDVPAPSAEGPARELPAEVRDLVGRPVTVKLTVHEAREKEVPALDDDFAKDTGDADTLDELRGKLREKLIALKEKQQEQELRAQLVKKVLEKNPFEVAPALIERQAEILVSRTRLQLAMRGLDPRRGIDESGLKETLRPAALAEVRSIFLIDAVARKENVEVSDADVEKKLAEMAHDLGKNVPRLKAELQKEGKFDQIRHQLREEKTLDLLMSRANITVKRD